MSKTEYAWVIQRYDAKDVFWGDYGWTTNLRNANLRGKKEYCLSEINVYNLKNCTPVKVKIEIVGEDDE